MSKTLSVSKLTYWAKLLSKFVSVQIMVQALNLCAGILIVRTLEPRQYAYFTIANTMQAVMNSLADMGISISLSTIGGKIWQDSYRFGQLINTALKLRYYLAAISITVVTPILIFILLRNSAKFSDIALITIMVLVGLYFQLTVGVLMIVPRLYSQIRLLRNIDLISAIARLGLLGISYGTFWNAGTAIASASVMTGLQYFILGRYTKKNIDAQTSFNQQDSKFIQKTIKNVLPNTLFFCVQGQLTVFLISIFGSTQNIAEIGALGRLSVIFTIISSIMSTIVIPGFARCQSPITLRKRYFQILGLYFLLGTTIVGVTSIFSSQILWILGQEYSHLKEELVLMVILTVVSNFVGVMSSLNLSKSWIDYIWTEIPMRLSLQVVLLMTIDISTIKGVIITNLISDIFSILFNAMLTYRGLSKYKTA